MTETGNVLPVKNPNSALECSDIPFIGLGALPPFKRKLKQEIACQIALHLAFLLEKNQAKSLTTLKIPSAIALSDFYQCTVLDVLDGLYAFKQKSNEYTMNGLDAEIILHNQTHILRTHQDKVLWRGRWGTSHKIAENPLLNLFQGKTGV